LHAGHPQFSRARCTPGTVSDVRIRAVAFDVGGVLARVGRSSGFAERWQERLGMTQGQFGRALASVDPDGLGYTGHLSETQFKARLSTALGLSGAQTDELLAEMCGELDAELVAYAKGLVNWASTPYYTKVRRSQSRPSKRCLPANSPSRCNPRSQNSARLAAS
jgi:hypothetical protein